MMPGGQMQPELHSNEIPDSVSQKVLAEIWEINVLLCLSPRT